MRLKMVQDENLDYAESLDDTESDPNILDANLEAGESLDSLEGYQNSEMVIDNAGMDNNTASFNTEVQHMVDFETTMNNKYGVRSGHYNLQPRKERSIHKWSNAFFFGFAMTQYNVNQGLKLFGHAGETAVSTELEQLHSRRVIEPKHHHELTVNEPLDALIYLMFLKEKHTGQIKGRGCADGRKQRLYMQKEDTTSPTVSIESLFISATIDTQEQRDVATTEIPDALVQADMVGEVHVKSECWLAEILTKLDPQLYTKYLHKENRKVVMYVKLKSIIWNSTSYNALLEGSNTHSHLLGFRCKSL